MRVSKVQAEKNRVSLLRAADRLFRVRGIDGVGVADVAKEAGLTHGALYAHFKSKEELAAEAFAFGFEANMERTRAWAGDRKPKFDEYMDGLLSPRMRDAVELGCPMAASASEIGRQGCAVSESFTEAFQKHVTILEASLEKSVSASKRRRLALTGVAAQIGAIAVSRAIAKTDPKLADEVLQAVRKVLETAHKAEQND